MKLYRNYLVIWAFAVFFFGIALTELLVKEKRLGFRPINSWGILSLPGKVCVVIFGLIFIYWMALQFIKDKK